MALSAQGMKIYILLTTGVTTATGALIGEVQSWNFNEPAHSALDASHMGSTMETVVPGIRKRAQLTFDCNHSIADAGQVKASSGARSTVLQSVLLQFPTTRFDAYVTDGYVSDVSYSGGKNDIMKVSYTFDINAVGSWTTVGG